MDKGGSARQRKENMLTHGLRKFAKRQMRKSGMDPVLIEYLMGHKSGDIEMGITKLMMTYDPSEDSELLTEYLKAIPNLTINSDKRERFEKEKAWQERDEYKEMWSNVNEKMQAFHERLQKGGL